MTHWPRNDAKLLGACLAMARNRSCMGECSPRHFADSSESSSSEADSDESELLSDDLDLGLTGKSEAQQKFRRLRRIFLNRPTKTKAKKMKQQRQESPRCSARLPRERRVSRAQYSPSPRRKLGCTSNNESEEDDRHIYTRSSFTASARPLQAAIDQHLQSLREQVKRYSAQRDSSASQVQTMLEQAIDELQFFKKQEERAMESQVRLLRESYALRLEVFQQQYLNKVTEIENEMHATIQKRQEECDSTVLAAAKKLEEQTQHALLKELPISSGVPIEELPDSSSSSTASSSASRSKKRGHKSSRPRRDKKAPPPAPPMPEQISPVSKQRAKLQALESKLAAFSPESLNRVRTELATAPHHGDRVERVPFKQNRAVAPTCNQPMTDGDTCNMASIDEWQPSPLSPLRNRPSYWKKGISLEERLQESEVDGVNNNHVMASTPRRRRSSASLLSRRFLRPEEEEELRHLRTSIGLAKDWMANNSQT